VYFVVWDLRKLDPWNPPKTLRSPTSRDGHVPQSPKKATIPKDVMGKLKVGAMAPMGVHPVTTARSTAGDWRVSLQISDRTTQGGVVTIE